MGVQNNIIADLKRDKNVKGLIMLLSDEDHNTREQAVLALGEIGDVSCALPLAQRMQDTYMDIRIAACAAFVKMGDQAVEPLIEVLKDPNMIVREGVVLALEKIGNPRAIQPLIEAFKDTNWKKIAFALKSIGAGSFELLIEALENEDSRIRIGAILTLSEMKSEAALNALSKLTKDKDPHVKQVAKSAVHSIKSGSGPKKRSHFA
jgi:HEAT repeat protein